tara:strand:- start:855 stop:1031 length:177 start_codon:yes stop_codon:yes gene_type:complete
MGRPKKKDDEKKGKISVTISTDNYELLSESNINKSKLINWLLEQHFGLTNSNNNNLIE